MELRRPISDGEIIAYKAAPEFANTPRIFYVNGMQTTAEGLASSAWALSALTEHEVHGVYNKSAGIHKIGKVIDVAQCVDDWLNGVNSKVSEIYSAGIDGAINRVRATYHQVMGKESSTPSSFTQNMRMKIPFEARLAIVERRISANPPVASLFKALQTSLASQQFIVAHSQGNLITVNALWALVFVYGEDAVDKMRVYSLANPVPAWPVGLRGDRRHLVYKFDNDLVTLADPHNWPIIQTIAGGRFKIHSAHEQFGDSARPHVQGPHDVDNVVALKFAQRIREDLGLAPLMGPMPQFIPK